ncbi:putative phospholipid-transporting ATPase IF [Pimephales promelas]|nr:putative phospholipid-transporting ATPase IF [Pimephales promelas]
MGTENALVRDIQQYLRRNDEDDRAGERSYITGASTANQRIESWWGQMRKEGIEHWIQQLGQLKDEGLFSGDFLDKALVQFCFMAIIQSIEEYKGIGCVDSVCCFSEGQNACSRLGRLVERMTGRCDPARASRCDLSLSRLCCKHISYKLEHDEPAARDHVVIRVFALRVFLSAEGLVMMACDCNALLSLIVLTVCIRTLGSHSAVDLVSLNTRLQLQFNGSNTAIEAQGTRGVSALTGQREPLAHLVQRNKGPHRE